MLGSINGCRKVLGPRGSWESIRPTWLTQLTGVAQTIPEPVDGTLHVRGELSLFLEWR